MNPTSTEDPEILLVGEDSLTFHVPTEMSQGHVVAMEVSIPAGGGPPMLHRHAADELYRVDTGQLAFYVEGAGGEISRVEKRAGQVTFIAGGLEHTIRNESQGPATAFVVFSGDASPMERFVREAAALAGDGPPAVRSIIETAERHGIEMTRPIG